MEAKAAKYRIRRAIAALVGAVVVLLSLIFLQNSLQIYEQSRSRTEQYLVDVTYQLHERIETRVQQSIEMLRLIRGGALDVQPDERALYLLDQTEASDFSALYLVDSPDHADAWLQQNYGTQYALDRPLLEEGKAQLLAIPRESTLIYFVADEATADSVVIIGVKQNDLLVELLSDNNFGDDALTLVITQTGEVITSRSGQNFFDELASSYNGTAYADVPQQFETMREDLQAGRSGTLAFPSHTGEHLLISYEPLSFANWCVFTVIPAAALNAGIEDLTKQNLVLTMVAILLLAGSVAVQLHLQRRHNNHLKSIAFTDRITGGWNSTRFLLESERLLRADDAPYAMVSLDVVDFTFLNNVYGVEAGDRVLRYIFDRLRERLGKGEICAHGSADIFYALLRGNDRDELERRLAKVKKAAEGYTGLGGSYRYAVRIGVYLISGHTGGIEWMEEKANLARKYRDGQACSFYREEKLQEQKLERELISDMPTSLRSGAFEVYLQPKVRLSDGCVSGAEALIRWNHPEKGMLSPGVFIPILEKAKMISRLDRFMFEQVCLLLQQWQQEGREPCVISVNLSRQNLAIPDLLQQYCAICAQYGVPPSSIELELTESIFMENTAWMQQFVHEIHETGFLCSLDDFGAGYSSLGLLKDLDIDVIKLDRSFFAGSAPDDGKGNLIVASILKLAQALHIRTVAEGIEQPRQVEMLQKLGCDAVQGFVFFRPMPVPDFERQAYENGRLRHLPCAAQDRADAGGKESPTHE